MRTTVTVRLSHALFGILRCLVPQSKEKEGKREMPRIRLFFFFPKDTLLSKRSDTHLLPSFGTEISLFVRKQRARGRMNNQYTARFATQTRSRTPSKLFLQIMPPKFLLHRVQ